MGALEIFILYHGYQECFGNKKGRPATLSPEERKRRDKRTPRIALKRYSESPFVYLFQSGNDQALLNCCAVDHVTFRELLSMFKPIYDSHTVDKKTGEIREKKSNRGRRRQMDAIGALGLVLYWFRTRGSCARAISMAFGLTSTPLYLWLKFSRKCLLFALQDNPDAMVLPPSQVEVDEMAAAVTKKYPILEDYKVWGAIDGLKITLQQSKNWFAQNMYYNGWKKKTFVEVYRVFWEKSR